MKPNASRMRAIAGVGLLCALLLTGSPGRAALSQPAAALASASGVTNGSVTTEACPLDVYLLMDLTGSMGNELATLQASAATITSSLLADNANTRFGIGWFQDYGYEPYGIPEVDQPYVRELDLTSDTLQFAAGLNNLVLGNGWDLPESQLPALYNTVTGAGDGTWIAAGQQANFRSEAAKVIVLVTDAPFQRNYGGIPGANPATYAQAAAALQGLPRAQVLGIFSNPDYPEYIDDLVNIVLDSGSLAPAGGVDCPGTEYPDILEGEPLVCTIEDNGAGLAEAFITLVKAVPDCQTYLPLLTKGPGGG